MHRIARMESLEPRRLLIGVVFPAGAVIDITQAPYHVVPDDGIDDTAAIQQAISDHVGFQFGTRILYFPDGVYDVSNTLGWRRDLVNNTGGARYFTMQGQSKEGTVFRLANFAAGFGSSSAPKPVIDTAPGSTNNNVAFYSHVKDLTIDIGAGNPGAIGLDFISSNMGSVRNVRFVSSDPNRLGKYGLALTKSWPGPLMVSGVDAIGFDHGIRVEQTQYSVTFERLTFSEQRVAGISTDRNVLYIRSITSDNAVPAISVTAPPGMAVVLDGVFSGGSSARSAIEIGDASALYARHIVSSGYATAIKRGSAPVPGSAHAEYASSAPASVFASPATMLKLPIRETPTFDHALDDIALVLNNAGNDTAAIQAALDSGKPVVMFASPPATATGLSFYDISATLVVPPHVRKIVGNYQAIRLSNAFTGVQPIWRFVGGSAADTTILENFNDSTGSGTASALHQHDDSRTLVFKDVRLGYASNHARPGDLFIDDANGRGGNRTTFSIAPGQRVWARQWNIEDNSDAPGALIRNDGGEVWILGIKTEGAKTIIETVNGGKTEVLGGFHYPVAPMPPDLPLYINHESSFSGAWATQGVVNLHVRETRDGVTRDLLRLALPTRGSSNSFAPLYSGFARPPFLISRKFRNVFRLEATS